MQKISPRFFIPKIIKALSCPTMSVGIFGLILERPHPVLWWALLIIGAILVF